MRDTPTSATIGIRAPHFAELLENDRYKCLDWFEVHSENFFHRGGPEYHVLKTLNRHGPVSLHGVGLSLGSLDPIDQRHLNRLKALVDDLDPLFVSEHLSWGSFDQVHTNELLPMPYTEEAIQHFVARIQEVQEALKRQILIENVSCYLRFESDEMPEWVFVQEIAERSGAKLLLDVNNIYVNATNHGFDPKTFIDAMQPGSIAEMHVAGFDSMPWGLLDSHGAEVSDPVWKLFEYAQSALGGVLTVLERDNQLPPLDDLMQELRYTNLLIRGDTRLSS